MVDDRVQPSVNTPASEKTILLVEDDGEINDILAQMIRQETSFRVLAVLDAPPALDLVKIIKPHLLLLDYGLPSMHGIELYDHIHAITGLEDVPAIMLSANVPIHEVRKRGMIYVRKPFDIEKLLDTINGLLAE